MNALLLIDLINEMVDPSDKLAGKGYAEFARVSDVPEAVKQRWTPADVDRVVHIGLQLRPDYADAVRTSLFLGKAPESGVARQHEAGAGFVQWASPRDGDLVVRKQRISAFFGAEPDVLLRGLRVRAQARFGVGTCPSRSGNPLSVQQIALTTPGQKPGPSRDQ